MLQDLLFRVLSGELGRLGRDGDGNIVLSPQSMDELSHKITTIIHDSIARPVVTVSDVDILNIGKAAGLRAVRIQTEGVLVSGLVDADNKDFYELVARVSDHAVRFALQAVRDQTKPKQPGGVDG